jgi:hypothetical protein
MQSQNATGDRLRAMEIISRFMDRYVIVPPGSMLSPYDTEMLDTIKRRLSVLREGLRTESQDFLRTFDELSEEVFKKIQRSEHDGAHRSTGS